MAIERSRGLVRSTATSLCQVLPVLRTSRRATTKGMPSDFLKVARWNPSPGRFINWSTEKVPKVVVQLLF